MKITRSTFCVLLAFICWTGCEMFASHNNPLKEGWAFREFDDFAVPRDQHHYHLDKAITDDYQDFIVKKKLDLTGAITGFFEDKTGQHAVQFLTGINGTWWVYTLIYDKENKRIKVTRYTTGGYRS